MMSIFSPKYLSQVVFSMAFLLIIGVHLIAQTTNSEPLFYFEKFQLPGGLRSNQIHTIAQDSFGFMWFGSQFGLHRWDGHHFKTYVNDPDDSTSISCNNIEYIHVAKDGTLWLATWGYGLERFNYDTETFDHFNDYIDSQSDFASLYINAIEEDRNNNLWLATYYGLYYLDLNTGLHKKYLHDPRDSNSLSQDNCRAIYMDKAGVLWIGTGYIWEEPMKGGLNRFRPETEDFERYMHDPKDSSSLSHNKVSAIFEDSRGNFWIGTKGDGLHLMDRHMGTFRRLQSDINNQSQLCNPFIEESNDLHVRFIFEDRDRKIWIGAYGGGIKYYDPESGYIKDFFHQNNSPQSLPTNKPWAMFQSQDRTLWVCTEEFQTVKVKKTIFNFYPKSEKADIIDLFYETKDRKLWIAYREKVITEFNLSSKQLTDLGDKRSTQRVPKAGTIEKYLKNIELLEEDNEGWYWIKQYGIEKLVRINADFTKVEFFAHNPDEKSSLGFGTIDDLHIDELGRIWVLTSKGHLNLFHPEEKHFTRYQYASLPKEKKYMAYFSTIVPYSNGDLLILGTSYFIDALPFITKRFDPEIKKFQEIEKLGVLAKSALRDGLTIDAKVDTFDNLWLCTQSRLRKFNLETKEFKYFSPAQFGIQSFRDMIIDDYQRIWLFGSQLILFDPVTENHISIEAAYDPVEWFDQSHPVFETSEGRIFFSEKTGFKSFDPRQIDTIALEKAPETILSNFQLLDQMDDSDMNAIPAILSDQYIELEHKQNDFTLQFAALNFQNPQDNRYECLLEGYDDKWRLIEYEPQVSYTKVPPGSYTFKVRSATQNSDWGPQESIKIIIFPPWWASWKAYTLYTLLVILLLMAFYRIQLNRKLDKAETYRLKELDAVKSRLYTNITHEFRTPLTVISGMAAQIEENPKEWFREGLVLIQRNSNRLLELVNQLLDLSKLESGKIYIKNQQSNIIVYLRYIVESIHSLAESKNINIHFLTEEDQIIMDFDPEKIQQVMINLLSNAVKFTPDNGHVYVSARIIPVSQPGQTSRKSSLQIKVRDTGAGIPNDQLPHIFDRFYQVDDTNTRTSQGSGIGLALVKELIKLMDGEIEVKSKLGQETLFTLLLPIKNDAPELGVKNLDLTSKKAPGDAIHPNPKSGYLGDRSEENITDTNRLKSKILLIEDSADVVAYIVSCLHEHYEVQVGKDGQEGIDIAIRNIPDLIITDVMMPIKDGFEVCETLKNHKHTSHIPIIMLTAKADIESKLEGLEKGADAYLAKPFHKKELNIRIQSLLDSRKKLQKYYLSIVGVSNSTTATKAIKNVIPTEDNFVQKLRTIVDAHLNDYEFNVEKFCKSIGMSHSQLHRKITALTGLSPNKFIRHIRLNVAKDLLQNTDRNISTVAYDTGFSDPGYFGRIFKREFGMTPIEWRQKVRI